MAGFKIKLSALSTVFHSQCADGRVVMKTVCNEIRPRGYKTSLMLNSVEHEILNAHKYENIKKYSIFQAQLSLECYFSCSLMLKCQQLLAF